MDGPPVSSRYGLRYRAPVVWGPHPSCILLKPTYHTARQMIQFWHGSACGVQRLLYPRQLSLSARPVLKMPGYDWLVEAQALA